MTKPNPHSVNPQQVFLACIRWVRTLDISRVAGKALVVVLSSLPLLTHSMDGCNYPKAHDDYPLEKSTSVFSITDYRVQRESSSTTASRLLPIGAIKHRDHPEIGGTATLVSENIVLTAAHVFPQTTLTAVRTFVLGLTDDPGNDDNLLCFPIRPKYVAHSHRGELDFVFLEIESIPRLAVVSTSKQSVCSPETERNLVAKNLALPCSFGYTPIRPKAMSHAATLLFAYTSWNPFPRGLAVHIVSGPQTVTRYTKDSSTVRLFDYRVPSQKGNSGGPLFDSQFNWIAIHQRSPCTAYLETRTDWSPYLDERYPVGHCDGNEPMSVNHVRQGTLLTDIAADVKSQLGTEAMPIRLPSFDSLLHK